MDKAPPITTLVMLDDEDFDPPYQLEPYAQSWYQPFIRLLSLLGVIKNTDCEIQLRNHRLCLQHTPDLVQLSRIFLSVHISPGLKCEVDIHDIRFDDSDSHLGQVFVAKLEEYANHVLSRVRVGAFVYACVQLRAQRSCVCLGLQRQIDRTRYRPGHESLPRRESFDLPTLSGGPGDLPGM